jgi:outer membrane protein OmpA-like peptidoglycan-associated protein/tetratricopeptide (TPR) repeat protein
MKKNRILLILFYLLLILSGFSQTKAIKNLEAWTKKAKIELSKNELGKAEKYLQKIFEKDSLYADAYLMQADIYNIRAKSEQAAAYYNKAIQLLKNPKAGLFLITAGEELKCGKYADAQQHLQQYQSFFEEEYPQKKEVEKKLAICKFALQAMQEPVDFTPINMGANINSEYDEYLASLTADEQELIFTVKRPRDKETICVFCLTEEDFYSSKKVNEQWQPRQKMPAPLNSSYNEGAQSLSPDGRYLFFTLCNADAGYGSCDLYWSKRIGSKWSRPKNFGKTVNTTAWESQPTVGPDGKTIYFVSNRFGGFGMFDIWKTIMIEEGKFSTPVNLGSGINTANDDTAPFLHADGKTLYFASDGRPGMGGYDLYYTELQDDNTWSEPKNLGYPINTYADEINLAINAAGTVGYFASDKEGGYGGLDLYYFTLDEKLRPTPVTYMKGIVRDAEDYQPLETQVELIDLSNNEIVTSTFSDPVTGEFLACIITGKNILMNVSHPDYLFYSENFQLNQSYSNLEPFVKDIGMHKAEIGKTMVLRNIFFEFGKSDLKSESFSELDYLADFLKQNSLICMEIEGHTDNIGNDEANLRLSVERAKTVYNYLINKGINSKRLQYQGYGETQPIADNKTEEGRAKNRRTAFRIIENTMPNNK